MSDDKNLIHVQYLGNSENTNNTGGITLGPDPEGNDREDIALLGTGYMTQPEIASAQKFGLVLRQVSKTADTDVADLKSEDIKEELTLLGKDFDEKAKVEELRSNLEVARAEIQSPTTGPAAASGAGDSVGSATASGSTNAGTAGPAGSASGSTAGASSAGSTSTGSAS